MNKQRPAIFLRLTRSCSVKIDDAHLVCSVRLQFYRAGLLPALLGVKRGMRLAESAERRTAMSARLARHVSSHGSVGPAEYAADTADCQKQSSAEQHAHDLQRRS